MGGWLEHAKLMEEAGADALELNVYTVATDIDVDGGRDRREAEARSSYCSHGAKRTSPSR